MKKKMIQVPADTITYSLSGSLVDAIKYLTELSEEYGPTAVLDIGQRCYEYDTHEHVYVDVLITREETDEEFEKRCAADKRMIEHRRLAYERLRAEFEPSKE